MIKVTPTKKDFTPIKILIEIDNAPSVSDVIDSLRSHRSV